MIQAETRNHYLTPITCKLGVLEDMGFFWSSSSIPQANSAIKPTADTPSADACPVDPAARSVWLQQAQERQQIPASQSGADTCPVDDNTRSIWLRQQQEQSKQLQQQTKNLPPSSSSTAFTTSPTAACSSDAISQSASSARSPAPVGSNLSQDREISSIPRAFPSASGTSSSSSANAETSTPETSKSGNWIYPSESQFFNAVLRKNHNTPNTSPDNLAETVSSIIPIHNAVNERAWKQIREWESNHATSKPEYGRSNPRGCPPKLLSFRGSGAGPQHDVETPSGLILSYLSLLNPNTPLTPRARWNSLLGYQAPFDRHDWVVERCNGEQIEYVIDFYQGKESSNNNNNHPKRSNSGGRNLNFYLDVRPKLTSYEAMKMRWRKTFGETE